MFDIITRIGDSVVQQGPHNDRVYVLKLARHDVPWIIDSIKDLATYNGYSKVFIKAPASTLGNFLKKGYVIEAHVPRFVNGTEDGFFLARFLKDARRHEPRGEQVREILAKTAAKAKKGKEPVLAPGYTFGQAERADAGDLARLYRQVFPTYPFPIFDEWYLARTMQENIRYFCVRANGGIVAASSAEMDPGMGNVEMSDFATHPHHRGKSLSSYLLAKMEEDMVREGMKTAYTIARALSYPVNRLFSTAGYSYCGTLVKNTNICGALESMNVWHKPLG